MQHLELSESLQTTVNMAKKMFGPDELDIIQGKELDKEKSFYYFVDMGKQGNSTVVSAATLISLNSRSLEDTVGMVRQIIQVYEDLHHKDQGLKKAVVKYFHDNKYPLDAALFDMPLEEL